MKTINLLALATLASAAIAPRAHAHIAMLGDLQSRTTFIINGLDEAQKMVPCDGNRGDGPIYTFEPGTTITISFNEVVTHPGYYRLSFDQDGQDFVDPHSIKPLDPTRACPYDQWDHCTANDFCSNDNVLFDNLYPHLPGGSSQTTFNWNITLPNVECDNCTLQLIQVMEDAIAHGGYCALDDTSCKGDTTLPDVYHRCIDMKLVKGATNSPGATTDPVSLPADYLDCKAASSNPGGTVAADAGTTTTKVDASTAPAATVDAGTVASTGNPSDQGATADTGSKLDASTANTSTLSNDAGSATPAPASNDSSSCALASSSDGAAWSLLALGLLLARRRRSA